MDAPLGRAVGNALEVIESIETLKGRGPTDLEKLSVLLAARMLVLAGVGRRRRGGGSAGCATALASGAGVEKFREIIAPQGGDPRVVDDYGRLPRRRDRARRDAPSRGLRRGARRRAGRPRRDGARRRPRPRRTTSIDPGVGVDACAPVGDQLAAGDRCSTLHRARRAALDEALALLRRRHRRSSDAPARPAPIVLARIVEADAQRSS